MVASKTRRYLQGDRFLSPLGEGTVTKVKKGGMFPYEITWGNGRSGFYSVEQIERYGYQYLPPDPDAEDIEEEELSLFDADFSRDQQTPEPAVALTWKDWKKGEQVRRNRNGLRGVVEKLKFRPQAVFILWEGLQEPIEYSPDDLELLEIVLDSGEENFSRDQRSNSTTIDKQCSDNSTCVAVSASASPLPDSNSEDLPLLAYANGMTIAETSSQSDIQESPSSKTLSATTGQTKTNTAESETSTSLPLPLPVPPSPSKANDSEPTTIATVFPQSSKRSPKSRRRTSRSKTSKACFHAHIDLEANSDTLEVSCPTFPSAGTMSSGSWSAADILERPFLESGCSWLASPGALSSTGKAPGLNRLESSLVNQGVLETGQVLNPTFLEDAFQIPLGWTDPLELRAATELLETAEKPSEIALTPELQRSLSDESSTSIPSPKTEEELTPVDESAIGKHYWCDRLDVTVTVETVHNWRVTPRAKELTKAARCRPWWGNFPDVMVILLDDLVEIEELSCSEDDRPVEIQRSRLQILKNSSPEIPEISITGISPNSVPVSTEDRSLEKKLGVSVRPKSSDRSSSLETPQTKQGGSLYQYTANKADKSGNISTYPRLEGERKREEDSHWYWGYSYIEKSNGKWRDRSASVPRGKLPAVREAMRAGKNYQYILQQVLGKD